ncbi:MAG: hypothetical protein EPO68_08335, partial [Planctomycetota bacterium]
MDATPTNGAANPLRWWWVAALCVALLPFLAALDAGLISEDSSALRWVHEHGALADWTTSEYDMRAVRFWRPLVTTTLGVQEALTGTAVVPLRLFNLACHAATALLAGLLALRLGGGRAGALAAGVLAAAFPYSGGTVVWIVGRVDSQCAPLVLGALVLALDGAFVGALLVGFLALATKEIAFVLPAWGALLALARGDDARRIARTALPLALALALALLARRAALDVWVGGYPEQALDWRAAPRSLGALARALAPHGALALAVLALALWKARGAALAIGACLACALVAGAPLVHVLQSGTVADEHRRTLLVPALALALAVGARGQALLDALAAPQLRRAVLAAALACAAWLAFEAWRDVHSWTSAGREAEAWVRASRVELASVGADATPALRADAPRLNAARDAYVLHWGVADRFREPFERSTRELWPWRAVFGAQSAERAWARGARGALLLPERATAGEELALRLVDAGAEVERLRVDERIWITPGAPSAPPPRIELADAGPAWIEAVLVTDLGYQAAPIAAFAQSGGASLRDVLLAQVGGGGLELWQVLRQSADLGATRAARRRGERGLELCVARRAARRIQFAPRGRAGRARADRIA